MRAIERESKTALVLCEDVIVRARPGHALSLSARLRPVKRISHSTLQHSPRSKKALAGQKADDPTGFRRLNTTRKKLKKKQTRQNSQ